MKDVYVFFSDYEDTKTFRELESYKPAWDYSAPIPEEIGLLNLKSIKLHLLLTSGVNKSCPWCGHDQPIIKTEPLDYVIDKSYGIKAYAECPGCLCRSPLINLPEKTGICESNKEIIDSIVLNRWINKVAKFRSVNKEFL